MSSYIVIIYRIVINKCAIIMIGNIRMKLFILHITNIIVLYYKDIVHQVNIRTLPILSSLLQLYISRHIIKVNIKVKK